MAISDEDINACAVIVQRADPDRFQATMAAPVRARAALFALYAFNVEVARAPWVTQEPIIAEMRLQWWRDALEEIAIGKTVRRHEVTTPLGAILSAKQANLLDALIAARRWDIGKEPFEDTAHFEDYIQQTSGNLMLVAAQVLGQADEGVVRDFAYGVGLANWLGAIPALEGAKRIPLLDGRPEAVRSLAQVGLERMARARANRKMVAASARPALMAGWQAKAMLHQAVENPMRVMDGTLGTSDFWRRSSLMARALSGRW